MFPNLLKMVQVKHLKLLRITLWGYIIGSLVPLVMKQELKNLKKKIELEQAFGGAYRSYRINGSPKIDVDTFFNRIGKRLIELIERELKTQTSARIQTTAWIRFVRDGPPRCPGEAHDEEGQERIELAFNSLMTSVY